MGPADEQTHLYNKAYGDALRTNEAETARWSAYRQEHVDLKENLSMYSKFPRADILIPVGSKAFLPGQLYHTGEVMVSHGSGYFSECSSQQAQSIADRRIRLAAEFLQKYDRERSMFSDKLEAPLMDEAFAGGNGGQEIIEPYDEESEKRWRVEHRRRVRENKQMEAKARATAKDTQGDRELFDKLEEMELLEELENELDQLELPPGEDDDDQLGRLMRGEIRLNERARIAHNEKKTVSDSGSTSQPTAIANPTQLEEEEQEEIETTDDEGSGEEEDISAEFSQLLNETKNCTKEEKVKKFQAKLKDAHNRLPRSTTVEEKVDLYQLIDELEEALDFLRPPPGENGEGDPEQQGHEKSRKVQFSEHDQIKVIDNKPQDHDLEQLVRSKNTLYLPIVHSPEQYSSSCKDEIASPADIYRLFLEQQEASKPTPTVELKSILKNSNVANRQPRTVSSERPQPRKVKPSMPSDVLGEVVEHVSMAKEPSDAVQQPQQKKKVSRFKQQRN